MRRHLFLSVVLALLVTALGARCGSGQLSTAPSDERATAQRDEEAEPTAAPTVDPQTEAGAMTATPTPKATEVKLPAGAEQVVVLAQEDLARRLDLATEAIRVVSVEAVEWADASLGCPEPGSAYAHVVTPGFQVVLEVEGENYVYHTDKEQRMVYCESQGAPPFLGGESAETVRIAREGLARRLGISVDTIDVVAVIGQQFPADAFYCRMTKERIARDESPVVIPGESILLSAAGRRYEYHASDQTVIFCRQLR